MFTCFVLNDCSDDSGIVADMADQNVILPKGSTEQTLLTATASTGAIALDSRIDRKFLDVCAGDYDDEPWSIETDYKSGWDTRFKSGVYRGMPYGVVLRDYPKKVEPPIEVKSASRNMRTGAPSHRRNNFFFTAQNRRTHMSCSASERMQRVISQGFERIFRQINVQDSWDCSKRTQHVTTGL